MVAPTEKFKILLCRGVHRTSEKQAGAASRSPTEYDVELKQTCRDRRPRRSEIYRFLLSHRRGKAISLYFSGRRGRRPLRCMIGFVCFVA